MAGVRLTGGAARGRTLPAAVPSATRPSSARVREALFSLVGQDLVGRTFLDLYGGTGAVALEAWSRGARVTSVERDASALRCITANVAALRSDVRVIAGDASALDPRLGPFDVVFADPPYALDPGPVLGVFAQMSSGLAVLEALATRSPIDAVGPLRLDRVRTYGEGALWVYRVVC